MYKTSILTLITALHNGSPQFILIGTLYVLTSMFPITPHFKSDFKTESRYVSSVLLGFSILSLGWHLHILLLIFIISVIWKCHFKKWHFLTLQAAFLQLQIIPFYACGSLKIIAVFFLFLALFPLQFFALFCLFCQGFLHIKDVNHVLIEVAKFFPNVRMCLA